MDSDEMEQHTDRIVCLWDSSTDRIMLDVGDVVVSLSPETASLLWESLGHHLFSRISCARDRAERE